MTAYAINNSSLVSRPAQKIAIVGSGISGLACAHFLNPHHQVTLFEANDYLGGHTHTVDITVEDTTFPVDTGFLVFNNQTYPNLIALFKELEVETYDSDMSFGISLNQGEIEWAGTNLNTVFAQRKHIFSPRFHKMLKDILRFNREAQSNLHLAQAKNLSLQELLQERRFSDTFANFYLLPMAAAIWSSSPKDILNFPAENFLRFCINHSLLQVNNRPQWRTVKNGARTYVNTIASQLTDIRLNCPVTQVKRRHTHNTTEIVLNYVDKIQACERQDIFDAIIFATHAPDTLGLLKDASPLEIDCLDKIKTQPNTAILHTDANLMPRKKRVWSSWNYLSQTLHSAQTTQSVCVSYWLNQLQNLPVQTPVIVTLNANAPIDPEKIIASFEYAHPVFNQSAIQAQKDLPLLQGHHHTYFAGAWSGYGFHEDGLKSALRVLKHFNLAPNWAVL